MAKGMGKQLGLGFPVVNGWGGKRKGAGRKPKDPRRGAGVPHVKREELKARFPVHVTVRVAEGVWNLRSRRSWRVLEKAFILGGNRFGFRVVDYSVQHNHVHMICEADGESSLSRGVKGLCIRMARGLNRMMGRKGRVFADRYHAHILRTPSEVRNALHYVLGNHRIHLTRRGEKIPDSYREWVDISFTSRDRRFHPPSTWLLRTAHSTS